MTSAIREDTCQPMAPAAAVACGLPGFWWLCPAHGERGWPETGEDGALHLWHSREDAVAAYEAHVAERH
jgi:hypothetical protein